MKRRVKQYLRPFSKGPNPTDFVSDLPDMCLRRPSWACCLSLSRHGYPFAPGFIPFLYSQFRLSTWRRDHDSNFSRSKKLAISRRALRAARVVLFGGKCFFGHDFSALRRCTFSGLMVQRSIESVFDDRMPDQRRQQWVTWKPSPSRCPWQSLPLKIKISDPLRL